MKKELPMWQLRVNNHVSSRLAISQRYMVSEWKEPVPDSPLHECSNQ